MYISALINMPVIDCIRNEKSSLHNPDPNYIIKPQVTQSMIVLRHLCEDLLIYKARGIQIMCKMIESRIR